MAKKKAAKKVDAVQPHYEVMVNDGNLGGAAVVDLDELGDIARKHLVDGKMDRVKLTIVPCRQMGEHAMERCDGVK